MDVRWNKLHPAFRQRVKLILAELTNKGWKPVAVLGIRTLQEQNALYSVGRKPLNEVNRLLKAAGLPPKTESENKRVVTHAKGGESWHNLETTSMMPAGSRAIDQIRGNAVDIIQKGYDNWDKIPLAFWTDLGTVARKYGCIWGGDWSGDKRDRPHVEMKFIDSAPRTIVAV